MLAERRFETILELLEEYKAVSVAQLCEKTGASEATVRRDLNTLAQQGRLNKVHGGAVVLESGQFEPEEPDMNTKALLHVEEKERIARYAATQVNDSDLVFVDAGTTTARMVDHLEGSKATFVTNGMDCARRLLAKGLRAYVLGGLLKPGTEAVIGAQALRSLESYNFTKAFIGANGISHSGGLTTPDMEEAVLKTRVVERAYMSYALVDSSKFGKVTAVTICPLSRVCIITDRLPDESYRQYGVVKEVEGA